jgi:hypothetical protein
MRVDDRHRRLHRKLEEILGPEEAETMISDLESGRMDVELLRRDLQALELRLDAKLSGLEARVLDKLNDQTKTLVRTFMVSNAATVLAVAGLAFGAARLS